jgi:RNA polymerase sigma-70 factor (ECF subfamily)
MTDEFSGRRLGSLSTSWTLVRQAHAGSGDVAALAQGLLLERYGGAVRRYLLAVIRDSHAADELTQEFGLLLVQKKFHRADPERGRFRDYVKMVLRHLTHKHLRKSNRRPRALPDELAEQLVDSSAAQDFERTFDESWREQLMARVWERLAQAQPTFHAVLRLRADQPDIDSATMAERLTETMGKPFTSDNVRQTLRRARERFGDLLLHEVACSLDAPTADTIADELRELRLIQYCDDALERYRKQIS